MTANSTTTNLLASESFEDRWGAMLRALGGALAHIDADDVDCPSPGAVAATTFLLEALASRFLEPALDFQVNVAPDGAMHVLVRTATVRVEVAAVGDGNLFEMTVEYQDGGERHESEFKGQGALIELLEKLPA